MRGLGGLVVLIMRMICIGASAGCRMLGLARVVVAVRFGMVGLVPGGVIRRSRRGSGLTDGGC